jgi:hypothetical protein
MNETKTDGFASCDPKVPCDQPKHTQIFNADFLFIAISAVVVHTYAMVYTYLFVM